MELCSSTSGQSKGVSSNQASSQHELSTSRAVCQVCGFSTYLKRSGEFYVHGPRSNRCKGSGMLPSSQSQSHPPSPSPSSSSSSPSSMQSPSTVPAGTFDLTPSSEQRPLFNHRQRVRVLKRVPKTSRHLAASKLARILDDVTDQNTDASWVHLLKFCHRCFAQPKQGGRQRSLAALVNQQLQEELDPPQSLLHCPSSRPAYDPLKYWQVGYLPN